MTPALQQAFERARLRLAATRAAGLLALLGTVAGLLSGVVIVAFRLLIETLSAQFMPARDAENFEALPVLWQTALPIGGAFVLALVYSFIGKEQQRVGVAHVLQRLQFHEGAMPFRNLLVQFFGGTLSLLSGHSVGRESPSIHLGAGVSSQLAQRLHLPNNAVRTLLACGTAAGIAASFNTPLAGVIFAMEVVMMEYTLAGFTPVILAAVAATAVTQAAFGSATVFNVPRFELVTLWELGVITLLGILVGALAAAFSGLTRGCHRVLTSRHVVFRFLAAGGACALAARFAPEVLGLGYDTVNHAILGDFAVGYLLLIVAAKVIATAFCVGAGLPGGLIGPTLLIGACAGGAMAWATDALVGTASSHGLFVILGMGAMMSAVLQAPLAALLALLEMTGNPNLILPSMLAVIAANLTYKEIFARDSVIVQLLGDSGFPLREHPLVRSLSRIGVTAVMNTHVVSAAAKLERKALESLLAGTPTWVSVTGENQHYVMPAVDIARYLEDNPDAEEIELGEIPAQRMTVVDLRMQATLASAHEVLASTGAGAVRVMRRSRRIPGSERVLGVVLPRDIETYYAYRPRTSD